MLPATIRILVGLFIWMVLPKLVFQKNSKKKAPYKKFTFIACAIIGVMIIVHGVINF